jgi:hypothetical protein
MVLEVLAAVKGAVQPVPPAVIVFRPLLLFVISWIHEAL